MVEPRQDDPEVVRREYAVDAGLAARQSIWSLRVGPQPLDVAFDAVESLAPRRVLEVGCGRGEFAERLVRAGYDVVATDQSEHMVALTRRAQAPRRPGPRLPGHENGHHLERSLRRRARLVTLS